MRQLTPDEAFAERLRQARGAAGMTRADVAARLVGVVGYVDEEGKPELSEQAIGAIERKTRRVSLSDALAVAAALDVAPINLMVPWEQGEPIIYDDPVREPIYPGTVELKVGENLTFIPQWARAWIKGVRTRWEAGPTEIVRYYVGEVPPPRRWWINEMAAAIRADDGPRVKELSALTLLEDQPHLLASHRAGRLLRLPAGLWSLLTDRPEEEA